MGYDTRSITVMASVSRHNSPKDDEHDALWEELQKRVGEIVEDPRYQDIAPMWG